MARVMRVAGSVLLCLLAAGSATAGTSITINGSTIQASGTSITVTGETVIVDGIILPGNSVQGSGKIASETRTPGNFDELRLDIAAEITITKGDTARCVVTADDNILPLILTESLAGVLRIYTRGSFASRRVVSIALQVPHPVNVAINGSGKITLAGVSQEALALAIRGSGTIRASGKVSDLSVSINGSGTVTAADLEAQTVAVTINGSGDATVHAVTSLTAAINGSGTLGYSGKPPGTNTAVKGTGGIIEN
jgi:hypothetical protein